MKMLASLLVTSLYLQTCDADPLSAVMAGVSFGKNLISVGEFIWGLFPKPKAEGHVATLQVPNFKIYQNIELMNANLLKAIRDVSDQVIFRENLIAISNKIDNVERFYNSMLDCYMTPSRCSIDVINTALAHVDFNHAPQLSTYEIHKVQRIYSTGSDTIVQYFGKHLKDFDETCAQDGLSKSVLQMADEYRQMVQAAEVKVYLTLRMAAEIAMKHGKENRTEALNDKIKVLNEGHVEMMRKWKKEIGHVSRDVWRCDPDEGHKEGVTYMKLIRVFQGYLVYEKDIMYHSFLEGSCEKHTDVCGTTNPATQKNCMWGMRDYICNHQDQCGGTDNLWNCKRRFFHNFDKLSVAPFWRGVKLEICPSGFNQERRYEFAYAPSEELYYVKKDTCSRQNATEKNIYFTTGSCYLCYCVCDDKLGDGPGILSERAFYVKPVESDFLSDFVVVGARLRKHKDVTYIEVQQGKLLPNGQVDEKSISEWIKPSEDSLEDRKNQFEMHWEERSVALLDIDLPPGFVLLGLKFDTVSNGNGSVLVLTPVGKPFDFDAGTIIKDETAVALEAEIKLPNELVDVHEKRLPRTDLVKVKNNHVLANKYLNFTVSNLTTDLGQNTIPFIDIQDVTTSVPTLMGGVGLYYKQVEGDDDHAGFLALKLRAYDLSPNINFDDDIEV